MHNAPRTAAPVASVLVLLALALLAAPALIPGDGMRWRPGPDGLTISRVLDDRDLGVGAGARIVAVNSAAWSTAAELRQGYAPPAWGNRSQYVIHEAGFVKRRIVPLRALPLGAAVRGYGRPAFLLLTLAALALWTTRRNGEAAALLLAGAGVAVYTLGNLSPLALSAGGLRHLEAAALCWTVAGALVLARAAARGHPAWWVTGAVACAAVVWLGADTRWLWWRSAVALTAAELLAAVALLALHQREPAACPGVLSRGPKGNAR